MTPFISWVPWILAGFTLTAILLARLTLKSARPHSVSSPLLTFLLRVKVGFSREEEVLEPNQPGKLERTQVKDESSSGLGKVPCLSLHSPMGKTFQASLPTSECLFPCSVRQGHKVTRMYDPLSLPWLNVVIFCFEFSGVVCGVEQSVLFLHDPTVEASTWQQLYYSEDISWPPNGDNTSREIGMKAWARDRGEAG